MKLVRVFTFRPAHWFAIGLAMGACTPTPSTNGPNLAAFDAGPAPSQDAGVSVTPDARAPATGCQPKYVVRKLDPAIVYIADLNDHGQFVGVVSIDNGSGYNEKPFVSSLGAPFETFSADQGAAWGINNAGAVVGTISRSQPSSFRGSFRWDPPTRPDPGPNGWGPGFHELAGYADNPASSVTATLVTDTDLSVGYGPTTALQFVSAGFGTLTVDSPSGCDPSDYRVPRHANEAGRIVGSCRDKATQNFRAITFAQDVAHVASDLGGLPGTTLGSRAHRVNKSGEVVGESRRPKDGYLTATRWGADDIAHDLGSLPFDTSADGSNCAEAGATCTIGDFGTGHLPGICCASVSLDINDAGWMVGASRGTVAEGSPRSGAFTGAAQYAVVWRGGELEKLDDLTCSICTEPTQEAYEKALATDRPGLCLMDAASINNKGQIIAFGYDLRGGSGYALLDPVP